MKELIPEHWSQEKKDFVLERNKNDMKEKEKLNEDVTSGKISGREFANSTNAILQKNTKLIYEKLGRKDCIELFNRDPDEPVFLLDPEKCAKEDYTKK